MKVAVIGNGNVGMAVFKELQNMREVHEIALVGRNKEKIEEEITDYLDAKILRTCPTAKLCGGGYELTEGADILIYTAGAAQKPGQSRLELVGQNVEMTKNIFEEVNKYNRDAIIIVLSNPVDIITTAIQKFAGRPANKVIGTGTLLDTARLRRYVSSVLDVSSSSVDVMVLGEHGDSSCIIWSALRVLGMSLDEYLSLELEDEAMIKHNKLSAMVRQTAGKLISAKGFTAYGVAAAACRVVSAIVNDTHEILPLTVVLNGEYDVSNLAISVPCMIGRNGLITTKQMKLTESEKDDFMKSASILQETAKQVGL